MNITIAYASLEDTRFFPDALARHEVRAIHELRGAVWEEIEAIATVHGRPFGRELIDAMPRLRLIVTRSTGYDHIDLQAAAERGIQVSNVPEYGSTTVAEFTMGLILSLTRKIPHAVSNSRRGEYTVENLMGVDLAGKTLGIVGLGKIGRNLQRMAEGFSMKIVIHDPARAESIPLDDLLGRSDVIALCCPLTPETHRMIDAEALEKMKRSAYLVNTARGAVVDSAALLSAVERGQIAGAALDVLEGEDAMLEMKSDANVERNLALMKHRNLLVTPHLAYDSVEAVQRIRQTTVDILQAFSEGRALHVVPSVLRVEAAGSV